jgi:hypothetical protein
MERQRTRQGVARQRAGLVVAAGLLCGAAPGVVCAVLADRLPGGMLVAGGAAAPRPWPLVIAVPALIILACCAVVAGYLLWHPRAGRRWMVSATWAWPSLLAAQGVEVVARNIGPTPWWLSPPAQVTAALVAGAAGWWAAGSDADLPVVVGGPRPAAPRMSMRAGERAVWIRSVVCARRLWQAAGWTAWSVLGWFLNGHLHEAYAVPLAVVPVLLIGQAWARVRVDGRGVWVEQPWLRRTLVGVDLAHVREATAEVVGVPPLPGGFGVLNTEEVWGYRATRRGELLRLATSDGRDFVVTVPDAASAAALVNTELDRRGVSVR